MENGRKLYRELEKRGLDAAIYMDNISEHWLTEFPTEDAMVIVFKQETLLITDPRYIEAAKANVAADVRPVLYEKRMMETVKEYVHKYQAHKVGYDGGRMTVSQLRRIQDTLEGIELVDIAGICDQLREIKTQKEIQEIRNAQKITDAAFTHICSILHCGMTELEVAAELEYFMRKNGADGLAFETIAVSGRKSSLPHGVPGNVVLTKNSFLTMDYGARYNGYCSDMTRTVVLGRADDEMKTVYQTVLDAQTAAIAALKPGATGAVVDAAARNVIKKAGYGPYFTHSTGHSLGLEIHESPFSSFRSETAFVPGQLQTSEPGIYIEGKFGVRIEDLLLVTEEGAEDLTTSEKKLVEL